MLKSGCKFLDIWKGTLMGRCSIMYILVNLARWCTCHFIGCHGVLPEEWSCKRRRVNAGCEVQVGFISVAMSQSELLQKEVFLVEKVDAQAKETMGHLKAVTFLRPTAENIQHLKRHLHNPRFGEYHLCRSERPFFPYITMSLWFLK